MKVSRLSANGSWIQRFHFWLGILAGVYFLFLAVTGVVLNHRTELGLEERFVSHRYLPSAYRSADEGERTRMDIVVADLHSGQVFGKYGPWVNDGIALFLGLSTLTGFALAWRRARAQRRLSVTSFPLACENGGIGDLDAEVSAADPRGKTTSSF